MGRKTQVVIRLMIFATCGHNSASNNEEARVSIEVSLYASTW